MKEQDRGYYEILGVAQEASAQELKQAYRRLAKALHPDLHGADAHAQERLQEINEAYRVLSNPQLRRAYDQQRKRTAGRQACTGGCKSTGAAYDSRAVQGAFARFFGFDPDTGQQVTEQTGHKGKAPDMTAMLERFMGF